MNADKIQFEIVSDPARLQSLKDDWNGLLAENPTQTIELTWEWQSTYWKHFNEHSRLFVLAAWETGCLVGLAPLLIRDTRRSGLKTRVLEFIASSESNYQDFIYDRDRPDVLHAILNFLLDNNGQWDVFYLRHIPGSSPTADLLSNGSISRLCLLKSESVKKTIHIEINGPWEDYKKSISKSAMWRIRNRTRKLAKIGEISSLHCSNESEFEDYLKKFFELHRKRWNNTDTPSNFNDERYCNFYLDIIPALFPDKKIDLYVLNVGDDQAAMLFTFRNGESSLVQLVVYNPDYSKFSPSLIANHRFVEDAFSNGIKVLDFGDYFTYKETWAREIQEKVSLELYPRKSLRSRLFYYITRFTEPFRDGLKKIGPLRRMIRKIRE
jgi:CelD/BcsL family acetyltransferase involved in cellulose biosynthesis